MSTRYGFDEWRVEVFADRADASEQLAVALKHWRGKKPLVLAIPRGAVPMGKIIAERLNGELDIVLTRKLHAPGNSELAVGAIDENGWLYVSDAASLVGADDAYIRQEAAEQLDTIRRRRALYTPTTRACRPRGRRRCNSTSGILRGSSYWTSGESAASRSTPTTAAFPASTFRH